ncbi:hypothetical protein GZH53_07805 [Flavihumibacter sp. R14]|nr:hypothetical protein [Flavihumibacter soli]
MSADTFTLLIDDEVVNFDKGRVITIEPYEFGTKIILEASHTSEEPIIYFTREEYAKVMKSYLS